jgi:tRNA A-37 threonylcarbamoyl transferase component Bud32/Tol biopolymer transport system component
MSLDSLRAALADRYAIERELGQGGMATVYLAHDLKHDRPVAIKVLKPELAAVLGAERFIQEIKTTAALSHPHILPLFDSGSADGQLYYVMPYIEGETVREKLNRETQFGIDEAVKITTEVADALDYAHRHGVIHRDIKPENILLHDGRPMVMDFGIALAVSAAAGGRMTETGLSLGTPHYMSPEQATADKTITNRSDIYSLGAVLYEMLAGNPPHIGSSAQQIIMKIIAEPTQAVTVFRRSVPANVAAAVQKALEKLPADRFETANELGAALADPHFTTATTAGNADTARGFRRWIRNPWSVGSVAVTTLVAMALVLGRRTGPHASATFSQQTFSEEAILSARFAPDGRTIVYSGTTTGENGNTPHLFVIHPQYPAPEPLGPDSTRLLAVSASGQLAVLTHAVYQDHRVYLGTLATMPLGGGAPREILTGVQTADWGPDGTSMAIIRLVGGIEQIEFPVGTVLAKTGGYFSDLRVSPAGNAIAFLDHAARWDNQGAAEIIDHAGKVLSRSAHHEAVEGLAWLPNGRSVLYSGSAQANQPTNFAVYSLDEHGHERAWLQSAGGLTIHDVARDGRWLASHDDLRSVIFARPPGSREPEDVGVPSWSGAPVLSPDGTLLAFSDQSVTGGPDYTVVLRKTDGSPPTRLGDGIPLAISRDGRWVLAGVPSDPPQLVLYPTGAGKPRRLQSGPVISYYAGAITADGRDYFYCASDAASAERCYLAGLDGGAPVAVTPEGTGDAVLSPDARHVAARVNDTVYVFLTAGGKPQPVPGLAATDHLLRWSPDGRALWVYRDTPPVLQVDAVEPRSGRRSRLTSITLTPSPGLRDVFPVAISDNPNVYAYSEGRITSSMFIVDSAR